MKLVRLLVCACLAAAVPAAAQPAQADGPNARNGVLQPDDQAELQWSASVGSVRELTRQGQIDAHFFTSSGGDPAMNGLDVFLAFYLSPAEGHRVFRIGDFLDYSVVSEAPGRLTLAIRENVMNDATGEIGTRSRRIAISWRVNGDEVPATITIAPAR